MIDAAHRACTRPGLLAAGGLTLRAVGVFDPAIREYLHTLYQFTGPWLVDDSKFRQAFDEPATGLDDALVQTFAWYRDRTAVRA